MREEGHIETEIEDVLHRFNLAAEDIDGIGDDLKGIERNAHRQDDGIDRETPGFAKSVTDISEDIEDLKEDFAQAVRSLEKGGNDNG